MNLYVDLNRIEFVITGACSGWCKHCGNSERSSNGVCEPLLFADTVCKIHSVTREGGIPKPQLITNGFFSKNEQKIDEEAKSLCESDVDDILLSVDVFHPMSWRFHGRNYDPVNSKMACSVLP